MIYINPREVAAEALLEIMKEEAYNNIVLKRILRRNGAMSTQDKAFVTEIVNGTLRNIIYIDYIINKISNVKTEKMKPWVASVLRTGVYQLKFMDKTPNSAVCNESVKLVKEKGFGSLSGFVNGVLRNVIRKEKEIALPKEIERPDEYLSVLYSYPLWILRMWLSVYSYEFVKELCIKNNTSPDVTIVCNSLKISKQALKENMEKNGVVVKDGFYYKNALHISRTSDITSLDLFKLGLFHVQDESSMLAVQVLDPKPGEKILDLCAAPGGKSILAAEIMKNKGEIIARDIYEHKLSLMEETAQRLDITIIKTQQKDATILDEESKNYFDRVLVDAPCSGLGLIRKKPDIKLRKSRMEIDVLCQIQKKILHSAAEYVKIGGIVVYSTCTICKKENEKNVEWFLEQHENFKLEDSSTYLPSVKRGTEKETGGIQLFPHIHNTDGFFIARFKREE